MNKNDNLINYLRNYFNFKNARSLYLYLYLTNNLIKNAQTIDGGSENSIILLKKDIADVFHLDNREYSKKNGGKNYDWFNLERNVIIPALKEINSNNKSGIKIIELEKIKETPLSYSIVLGYKFKYIKNIKNNDINYDGVTLLQDSNIKLQNLFERVEKLIDIVDKTKNDLNSVKFEQDKLKHQAQTLTEKLEDIKRLEEKINVKNDERNRNGYILEQSNKINNRSALSRFFDA